uniref:Uncharacterized protein n=1 Tax=Medicago truncatula TaxID=3880 RepID=A2Q623_MEDTR|nr:hypothetical protein MtrDRAFT_AC172742g30v1 [Medicago truncatula]
MSSSRSIDQVPRKEICIGERSVKERDVEKSENMREREMAEDAADRCGFAEKREIEI